jgi:hypothetical protein
MSLTQHQTLNDENRVDCFVVVYRSAYLFAIPINLLLLIIVWHDYAGARNHLVFSAIVFAINGVSWYAYLKQARIGRVSEQALSLGRMITPVAVSTIVLSDLALYYSPVGVTVWWPLISLTAPLGKFGIWAGSALLFALEVAYFVHIRQKIISKGGPVSA